MLTYRARKAQLADTLHWQHSEHTSEVGSAFSAVFGTQAAADGPASGDLAVAATMLISQFVDEAMLIEVELDAVVA